MKNKRKLLIIFVCLIILGICFIVLGITLNNSKDLPDDLNPSTPGDAFYESLTGDYGDFIIIDDTKIYNSLEISSFRLQMIGEKDCEITAIVENKTNTEFEMQNIKMKLYDNKGTLRETIGAQIDSIKPGEQKEIATSFRTQSIDSIAKVEIEEN